MGSKGRQSLPSFHQQFFRSYSLGSCCFPLPSGHTAGSWSWPLLSESDHTNRFFFSAASCPSIHPSIQTITTLLEYKDIVKDSMEKLAKFKVACSAFSSCTNSDSCYGHNCTDKSGQENTVNSPFWTYLPLNQCHIKRAALTPVRAVPLVGLGKTRKNIPQRWILRHDKIVMLYMDSEEAHQVRSSKD